MSKIYLSPSDQYDNMYSGVNTNEGTVCMKIANACAKYLKLNGYEVKVGSPDLGFVGRVQESNGWGADVHIPIHTNAGGGDGTLVMCYNDSTKNPYVVNIYREMSSSSPGRDDGIRVNDSLYEIVNTNCVCVYLECEFHDRSDLANWIVNNTDGIGRCIATGVCMAEGKTFKTSTSTSSKPSSPSSTHLYKVQCGAFKDYDNASALVSKLKNAGFTTYMYRDSDGLHKVQVGAFSKKANAEQMVKTLKKKGFDAFAYQS